MTGTVLGYVRISSTYENPARQIEEVDEVFIDHVSDSSRAKRTDRASGAAVPADADQVTWTMPQQVLPDGAIFEERTAGSSW